MREHPQVLPPRQKELHFLAAVSQPERCHPPSHRPSARELAAYAEEGRFPRAAELDNASGVTGEWSATYYACSCCPAAVRRTLPGVRLILQLRDPLLRAFSRFAEIRKRVERVYPPEKRDALQGAAKLLLLGFEHVVGYEINYLGACMLPNKSMDQQVRCASRTNVVGLSLYDLHIKHWLQHFPAGELLVTYADDLTLRPQAVMREVEAHLGIRRFDYGRRFHEMYNVDGAGWEVRAERRRNRAEAEARVLPSKHPDGLLKDFLLPHVRELLALAASGAIRPPPDSWVQAWGL